MKQSIALKKLKRALSLAIGSEFFQIIWAIDALGRGNSPDVSNIFRHPPEAKGAKIGDKYAIFPWDMEDLINVELVTPKKFGKKNRTWNCKDWSVFAELHSRLKTYHDLQHSTSDSAIDLLSVIAHKQFSWQRGYLHYNLFYRSAYLYGGDAAQKHMKDTLGFSLNNFSLCGFLLISHFLGNPWAKLPPNISEFPQVSSETMRAVISHISKPIDELRSHAKVLRKNKPYHTYSPSILRQFPCAEFSNSQLTCPLIDLLVARVTEGVYYDVISGSTSIHNEIGSRFESYSLRYLQKSFSSFEVLPEIEYGSRRKPIKSPDIIVKQDEEIVLLVECKATRMPLDIKFKLTNESKASDKFKEIAKGVCQIWRCYSDIRLGRLNDCYISDNALGLVLTLEDWTTLNRGMMTQIMEAANTLADKNSDITVADRKTIAICHIDNFESLLRDSNEDTFLNTIRKQEANDFGGWNLLSIHERKYPKTKENKPFPFKEELGDVLPWYKILQTLEE
ncbi:MAG: hypothetical protein JKY46_03060 [Robiginitomaculum sp.]|nr:hypothetical protein [Robiginitomaculum sp.]